MTQPAANPLIEPAWRVPPFAHIRPDHFGPALDVVLAAARESFAAMARDAGPPTLDTVVMPLETYRAAVENLHYLSLYYASSFRNDALTAARTELVTRIADFEKALFQDRALIERFGALYERRDDPAFDDEDRGILDYYHQQFEASGAFIDVEKHPGGAARLKAIDARLIALTEQFGTNLMNDIAAHAVLITDPAELAGLSEDQIASFAAAAAKKDYTGAWLITPERSAIATILRAAESDSLQRRLVAAGAAVGGVGPNDNRGVVREIRALRHEYASLLGYPNYKSFARQRSANKDLAAVEALYAMLTARVVPEFDRLMDGLRDFSGGALAVHNFPFWLERQKRALFAFDTEAFAKYLGIDDVLAGLVDQARRNFGLDFTAAPAGKYEVPPEIFVYDVVNRRTGDETVVLIDVYARDGKRGGGWMEPIYDAGPGKPAVVGFSLNAAQPAPGRHATLSLLEYKTVYHEWGHLLDNILGRRAKYPSHRNLENGPTDRAEVPSMVNEPRGMASETMRAYARHDGQPPSNQLLDQMRAAQKYFSLLQAVALLQQIRVDLLFHASGEDESPEDIARQARLDSRYVDFLRAIQLAAFHHLFAAPHSPYAARYDGYLLADIHRAAAWEPFEKNGLDDPFWLARLTTTIYGRGVGGDAAKIMEDYLGEPETLDPFLAAIGLTEKAA